MKFPKIKYTYYVVFDRCDVNQNREGTSTRIITTHYKVCNVDTMRDFINDIENWHNYDNAAFRCDSIVITNFILINRSFVWWS